MKNETPDALSDLTDEGELPLLSDAISYQPDITTAAAKLQLQLKYSEVENS